MSFLASEDRQTLEHHYFSNKSAGASEHFNVPYKSLPVKVTGRV